MDTVRDPTLSSPTVTLPRHELLGFGTNPGTLEDYLAFLADRVGRGEPCTVLYHNLHSLYLYLSDPALRRAYAAHTVLVDGMPLIWLMRLAGLPVRREHRLTYVDFIGPMMRLARDEGWRVHHVGQDAETQRRALERLRRETPGLDIDGQHGYFDQSADSAESLAVVDAMNAAGADLVLVGFGAPRQEAWIAAHRARIDAPAVLACGACMEYVAGRVRTPPRLLGRLGLEWAFRLLENPRRFAFRYAVEPLLLGAILARNAVRDGPRAGPRDGLTAGVASGPGARGASERVETLDEVSAGVAAAVPLEREPDRR